MKKAGADVVFSGEGEVALALTVAVLNELGASGEQIDRERERVRRELLGPRDVRPHEVNLNPQLTASTLATNREPEPSRDSSPAANNDPDRAGTAAESSPPTLTVRNGSHLFAERRGDFAAEFHRVGELLEGQRLVAVGQGVFRIGMHFQDQAVGAGRHAGRGHLRHQVRVARAVARIDHHRQMRLGVQVDHRGQRQREPGVRFERANAPFAEHHVRIAGVEDVLGRQQQLVDRGARDRA